MTTRYPHVVPELVEEANRRMGELLWTASPSPTNGAAADAYREGLMNQ